MAINKRNYVDGQTIITAANLNEIQDCIETIEQNYVPKTRTVNSKALSSNITLAASDVGAVPTSRTINSKALSSNITLSSSDVGAVPVSRTVNSKALSSNITLTAADVSAVPTTRTVNSKALSSNITLSASDVGAVPTSRTVNSKALSSDITLTASDVEAVPTTRTVNSKALSSNITLNAGDIGYDSSTTYSASTIGAGLNYVQSVITNKVLYYRNQTLTAASNAQILRIDDSALTGDHCVCELFVTDPSCVNGEITWRTYDGYMTLSGTCSSATNVNVLLVKTDKLVT